MKVWQGVVGAIVGVVVLAGTAYAATNIFSSLQAEGGTLSATMQTVADTSASGGSAIQFSAAPDGTCPAPLRTITAQDVSNRLNSGYSAGTEVYVPGSPDPWGGCFPNAANTGVPAGTVLTNYTGPCTITTAGTVIDSKNINCNLTIDAANVTIRNSKIVATNIAVNNGPFTFTDNEVNFGNNINGEGFVGGNYTILRANIYGGKRQVWCLNNCTLKDSYLHDQLADPTGVTHESAVRVEQYTTLEHNTLLCNAPNFPPDAGCSANQTGYPDFAPIHHNTMRKNLYMATTGGYCSYGGWNPGKSFNTHADNATHVQLIDNVFQRGTSPNDRTTIAVTDKRRYTCGQYGATSSYNSSRTGFVFTGNRWDDGLLFVNDTTYPYGGFY